MQHIQVMCVILVCMCVSVWRLCESFALFPSHHITCVPLLSRAVFSSCSAPCVAAAAASVQQHIVSHLWTASRDSWQKRSRGLWQVGACACAREEGHEEQRISKNNKGNGDDHFICDDVMMIILMGTMTVVAVMMKMMMRMTSMSMIATTTSFWCWQTWQIMIIKLILVKTLSMKILLISTMMSAMTMWWQWWWLCRWQTWRSCWCRCC